MSTELEPPNVAAWCAYAAMAVALPTALWRLGLAAGFTLGTPDSWREFQDIPGTGTVYVLVLSVVQLLAIACMFTLTVHPKRLTPRRFPPVLARRVPLIVVSGGMAGTALLVLIVAMSVVAWDAVNPYAGVDYDVWAWLGTACYFVAVFWPALLGAASVSYWRQHRV